MSYIPPRSCDILAMAFAILRYRRSHGASASGGLCVTTETLFYLIVFMYVILSLLVFQLIELRIYSKSISSIARKNSHTIRDLNDLLRDVRLNDAFENSWHNATRSNDQEESRAQTHGKIIDGDGAGRMVLRSVLNKTMNNTFVWQQFVEGVTLDELYPRHPPYMPALLEYMSSARIVNASIFKGGTQAKLLLRFDDGHEVIAKPMRHPRNFYWGYNDSQHFSMDEERHTAEIASFHLDRILDFRKVIPCVGRNVNFTSEILPNTDDPGILDTLKEIEGDSCFIGYCARWFCNENHPICASHDGLMELSMCARLPGKIYSARNFWSQGVKEAKIWKNKNVCKEALQDKNNLRGRFFLDTMEVALFDNLMINYDRHHYDRSDLVDRHRAFVLINDNGKGFGNPYKDDVTFLAPIYQCCRFRNSTYQHLLSLSGRLGNLMQESLPKDPLAPILTDPFLAALDRRLDLFYDVINKCLRDHGPNAVFLEGLV